MNDRELLELAAKAAGYKKYYFEHMGRKNFVTIEERFYNEEWLQSGTSLSTMDWNPLDDDGDALRLAVKLQMQIDMRDPETHLYVEGCAQRVDQYHTDNDPYAATRRAIVRAAAEIGKTL